MNASILLAASFISSDARYLRDSNTDREQLGHLLNLREYALILGRAANDEIQRIKEKQDQEIA